MPKKWWFNDGQCGPHAWTLRLTPCSFPALLCVTSPNPTLSLGFLMGLTNGSRLKGNWRAELGGSQSISPPSSLPQAIPRATIYNCESTSSHRTKLPASTRKMVPRLLQFYVFWLFLSGFQLLVVILGCLTGWLLLACLHTHHLANSLNKIPSVPFCMVSLFPVGLWLIHWLTGLFRAFLPLSSPQFPCL